MEELRAHEKKRTKKGAEPPLGVINVAGGRSPPPPSLFFAWHQYA